MLKRFLAGVLAVVALLLAGAPAARSQSLEPFSPYALFSPSADAWQMSRHGGLSPSLHTGSMTYTLLLYRYEDPDFTLPVSLEYTFDGYRPFQRSGTVGYGWSLHCGGVLTREVRGLPDEGGSVKLGLYDYPVKGWPDACSSGIMPSAANLYSSHRSYPGMAPTSSSDYTGAFQGYDPFSDIPVAYVSDGYFYDTAPDIYHFSIPGHSGDFMFGVDGSARVFNSDLPGGEVTVTIYRPGPSPKDSQFILCTGDGYSFRFIPDGVNQTVPTQGLDRGLPEKTVTAYRLAEITAPNGRKVRFNYTACYSKSAAVSYSASHSGSCSEDGHGPAPFSDDWVRGCNPVEEEYKALESVDILSSGGVTEARIVCSYAPAPANENGTSCFGETEMQTQSRGAVAQMLLGSLLVLNRDGDTVALYSFSHEQAPNGVPKSFLTGVTGPGMGRYSFRYNLSQALPLNDTPGTDHWGYWNGGSCSVLPNHVSTPEPDTAPASLYSQMIDSSKEAVPLLGMAGALTCITYPTGGTTEIAYEPHAVRRRLDLTSNGHSVELTPAAFGNALWTVGGVRVRALTDSDSTGVRVTEYDYRDAEGLGSGILQGMPRYVRSVAYSQSAVRHVSQMFHVDSQLSMQCVTGYDSSGASVLTQGPHVSYTSVLEKHPDGSSTRYSFSSVADDGYDDLRSGGVGVVKHIVTDIDELDASGHGAYELCPISHDRRNMRGRVLSEQTFDASGTAVRSVQYEYDADVVSVYGTAYNEALHYTIGTYTVSSPVLRARTETVHGMTMASSFTYNAMGQRSSELAVCLPAGAGAAGASVADTLLTTFTYLHEVDTATTLRAAICAASRARIVDGTAHTLASEAYTYGSWSQSGNPRPTQIAMTLPDGTVRSTAVTYDALFHPLSLTFSPGGASIAYTWNGNRLASRTDNGLGNTVSYSWKDLVGPILIVSPSGQSTSYGYDACGRLHSVADTAGSIMTYYDYKLKNE